MKGDVEAYLSEVDRRLRERYRTAPLGNLPDPLDELIFIQLSLRTREGAYTNAYDRLRAIVSGDWSTLLAVERDRLVSALESGGMASVKVDRLREQLLAIRTRFGEVTLEPLHRMPDEEAERFLLSLPGVGPKAARCVLLYSLNRDVFPVDSHCLRIVKRLELVPENLDRKKAHDRVQELIPRRLRHSLHVNMVHHGRDLCRAASPECGICPLLDLCPTGQCIVSRYTGPDRTSRS